MELQPESDQQPAIVPTQLIFHSIAAPWTPRRTYEFWRDSTGLESHFGVGFDGGIAQFVGTQTRADANMYANRRPDGTGAVSVETASNTSHSDPWTDAQLRTLVDLGVWVHRQHGVPLRVCRSHDDPGFGVHRLYPQWSQGGTDCPGDARVRQFYDVIMPGIFAGASGTTPNLPTTTPKEPTAVLTQEEMDRIADAAVYLHAQGLAHEYPPGASDGRKWLIDWYQQASRSHLRAVVGEVLDEKLSGLRAELVAAVQDTVGPAVAEQLAAGITLTVTTTKES
ncbi:peptidoglycan recognition protein family protein [Kitasatospora sp. NPDC054939]